MRKQYHFRQVGDDTYIWDVHHLLELSKNLAIQRIPLTQIQELHEAYWYPNTHPTTQEILDHFQLIQQANLTYPIILCHQGRVMDGMHRVAKAQLLGLSEIDAVQFTQALAPDFINIDTDQLDYDD